jgi:Phage integrase SAM-like domain
MACIAVVPPSPRHPHERYQVRYQDGRRQRSAGVFPTKRRAEAERRAIDRGRPELAGATDVELEQKARTLLGEYVATKWWPAWKDQHPTSEYGTRKKVEKRILPTFGNIPLGQLDASTIGAWKSAMVAEQLSPHTVNTYLSLLGTILNAAVDDDYLPRSPPGAQERRRPHRRYPQPAGPPPGGLAAASSSTGWSRRSTPATGRWSWWPR